MRPIRRDASPRATDYADYRDAFPDLVARLGPYCSFCERKMQTSLAVEHIQPKSLPQYRALEGRWENLLLACVNCNSTKSTKDVTLDDVLLPDRDNTFAAFSYAQDGTVQINGTLPTEIAVLARKSLDAVGLNKRAKNYTDANGKFVATDRVGQRMEAWLKALESKADLDLEPKSERVRRSIAVFARETGFFSIWMAVFEEDTDMRNRLIDIFPGTRESGCFDRLTTAPVVPAPNPDGLPHGGKA